jgi:hypothetical protein
MGMSIDDAFAKLDPTKNGISDGMNKVKDGFKEMEDFFKKIGRQFEVLPKRFKLISAGFKDIFEGIGYTLKDMFAGVGNGMLDIFLLTELSFVWIFTHIMCGVTMATRLNKCFFYYALDCMGQILYLPFRLAFWVISMFMGNQIYDTEKAMWDKIELVDSYFYNYLQFHIMHYPKNIRDWCYNCKRLKGNVLTDTSNMIAYDFKTRLPGEMLKNKDRMARGGDEINRAFTSPDP